MVNLVKDRRFGDILPEGFMKRNKCPSCKGYGPQILRHFSHFERLASLEASENLGNYGGCKSDRDPDRDLFWVV